MREVIVHHGAYVGFVDAHAEGVGGHHYADAVFFPEVTAQIFFFRIEAGVVEFGADAFASEQIGYLAAAAAERT